MEIPVEWHKEVADAYAPIRILGKGAFASVVLARDKTSNKKVAIKVIGNSSAASSSERETSLKYAHREVDILRLLDHPNIMKVENFWDFSHEKALSHKNTDCIMALTYIKGPTVESLLQHGGALSNKFGRIVVSQIASALAYIHYRGVVHRDIKPDNIIVTGALSKDAEVWDNIGNESDIKWQELQKKWKCTLVDFGFARALSPNDICGSQEFSTESNRSGYMEILESSRRSVSSSQDLSSRRSISHKIHQRLSALGNRNFAAPEIVNKVYCDNSTRNSTSKTLSPYVADYGLLVDSYSLGHTIRYMMTGVMPNESVEEAIRAQNSFCRKICGSKKSDCKRTVRYRKHSELPEAVVTLIQNLTELSESKRLSIRKACKTVPWISDISVGEQEEEQNLLSEISFLNMKD